MQTIQVLGYILAGFFLLWKVTGYVVSARRAGWIPFNPAGRLTKADRSNSTTQAGSTFLMTVALAAGMTTVTFMTHRFPKIGWPLFGLLLFAFLIEWLIPSNHSQTLPDTIRLMTIFTAATAKAYEPLDALRLAGAQLPPGAVKDAVEEALKRCRQALPLGACLNPLKKCHPFLKEFFIVVENYTWAGISGREQLAILNRAHREWRMNPNYHPIVKNMPLVLQSLRSFILGGLAASLWLNALPFHQTLVMLWHTWLA